MNREARFPIHTYVLVGRGAHVCLVLSRNGILHVGVSEALRYFDIEFLNGLGRANAGCVNSGLGTCEALAVLYLFTRSGHISTRLWLTFRLRRYLPADVYLA